MNAKSQSTDEMGHEPLRYNRPRGSFTFAGTDGPSGPSRQRSSCFSLGARRCHSRLHDLYCLSFCPGRIRRESKPSSNGGPEVPVRGASVTSRSPLWFPPRRRRLFRASGVATMSVSEMFSTLQGVLTADQDIREEIRKVVQTLEQTAREILTVLQGVHQGSGFQDIPKKCQKAREHFGTVRTQLASLKMKFPAEQYYRFHEHWRFVLQRLVFLATFVVYLETETLVTREAVTEILGIESERERGFHLDIEDYLSGVLTLASELSRLAVNSVTAGDYSRPLRISAFINELDSGFRLLNLKNDSLRKRYDGLKYDVKKIEEVVYDLSIRGLNKEASDGASGEK